MTRLGWSLVALSAGFTVAANLLLRAGVDRAGGFAGGLGDAAGNLARLGREPLFDLGVLLYGLASLVWFRVLSTEPLSVAYPVLASLTFVLVTLGAVVLFREPLSLAKVVGLALLVLGLFVVSQG
jgi:multidrug transporter EmrE-like cation transporter